MVFGHDDDKTSPEQRALTTENLPIPVKALGELLLRNKVISIERIREAVKENELTKRGFGQALADLGFIDSSDLTKILSEEYGFPTIDLTDTEPNEAALRLLSREICEKHHVFPVSVSKNRLTIAMANPGDVQAMEDVKFKAGRNIEVVIATQDSIDRACQRHYVLIEHAVMASDLAKQLSGIEVAEIEVRSDSEKMIDVAALEESSKEGSIIHLVNTFLTDAIKRGVSDIHFELFEKEFRVRYRLDGVLQVVARPQVKLASAIISRIKIMSGLDITERRAPQDGRIKLKMVDGKECDFRVSVMPFLFGEKIVMRLLDRGNLQTDMSKLGFSTDELKKFKHAIHQSSGIVLVTGPTGSGKTTTLYSALTELNTLTENISTAEDPVEYVLQGVNQCQINDAANRSFPAVLRAFLRQDPDVIMVGEIRDFETAEIAVKAAQTGHLVLSTLHTNDAPSAINRLIQMGVEAYMVINTINLVAAQRLVRQNCKHCCKPFEWEKQECLDAGMTHEEIASAKMMRGNGCKTCGNTGFKGRIAVYELMLMDSELREAVIQSFSQDELKRVAIRLGMQTLRRSALKKFAEGLTTLQEVLRVTRAD